MLKRCHKCQNVYDTEEYFCHYCGSILYDENTDEKKEYTASENSVQTDKTEESVNRDETEAENISRESNLLVKQISLLCKYVTGGTFRTCMFMVIAAVSISSIFEAFMQFATFTMQGETLTPYIASNIAFSLAISAFYALLPSISMYKISIDAENHVSGSEGAFIWKAGKSLTYIMVYFIIQTVITGGAIGFVLNASMISILSEEPGVAVALFIGAAIAAAVTLPYFISGLVTFSSAKGCLKRAIPLTARGAKCFGVCFITVNIISTVVLALAAVVFAVVKLADITFTGVAPIMSLFSKMSGMYVIYIFIMLIRSAADIVIAVGFLKFVKKLKGIEI